MTAAQVIRRMLGDVDRRATVLATDRKPLQQAQADQQHRRQQADLGIGRQEAHRSGRQAHNQDSDEESVFAPDHIPEAAKHKRAQRAHGEARTERGEACEEGRRVVAGRKEQRTEKHRQRAVYVEIVPFEDGAE